MIRRYYYDPETKSFSDQSIAKKFEGLIIQILTHLLKLNLRLNYQFDRSGHINDLVGWAHDIKTAWNKDKSTKSVYYVVNHFESNNNIKKLLNKIQNGFKKKYSYTGQLMMSDWDDCKGILIQLLSYDSKNAAQHYLRKIYPEPRIE